MQLESRNSGASSSLSANSPSFTSYSSENIADIAARVVHELNLSQVDDLYDFYSSIPQNDDVDEDDVESEFEFAILGEDTSSPISADEIFHNGQIKPSYPLFDTNLLYANQYDVVSEEDRKTTPSPSPSPQPLRLPLRSLMREERERGNDSVSTSSSSEDAELEGVPPETYCVWTPRNKEEDDVATMKKKSNSTGSVTGVGSSKRWRFRDLLHRSHSDGKDTFVFLAPQQNNGKEIKRRVNSPSLNNEYNGNSNGKGNNYGGKKIGEVKKKSYLPYRQDLVGLFSNVNGLSRTMSPF